MEIGENFSIEEESLGPLDTENDSHQNNVHETHLSDTKHIDLANNVQKHNKHDDCIEHDITENSLPISSPIVSEYIRQSDSSPINYYKSAGDASLSSGAPYLPSDTTKLTSENLSPCIYHDNSLIENCDKAEILNMNFKSSITKSRIKGACDFCRKRKLRCDRGKPCSHCDKRSIECIYSITPSKKSQTSKRFQKSNKFEEQFIPQRPTYIDRTMNRGYNQDFLYSFMNSNDVFNNQKRSNMKYNSYPPYNVTNLHMPLQNMYNERIYNESMIPMYQRRERFQYDDLEEIFLCVNIFIQIYQNTKVHGFSIAYNKDIIADYWRYLKEDIDDFETFEKENLLTLFEYVLIFLLGAIIAKSTSIVNKLTPIFESIFNFLVEKLKIKEDGKTAERFISCLILICSIYEYQGLVKLAYSAMNMAHYMIVTHKSFIRCRSIIECTYISLLTLANNKEERDNWIKILESYSPFSQEVILYLDLAYVISELKLNYDNDEIYDSLEKRLQNIDALLNERIYIHTVSYIKIISLILNLEITVRQKNLSKYSNIINQIALIARDLPTPLLHLIQSDCSNLKMWMGNIKDGMSQNLKSSVMDDVICIIESSLSLGTTPLNPTKEIQTDPIQNEPNNMNFSSYSVYETNNGSIHQKSMAQLPIHNNRNSNIQFQTEFQYLNNREWDNGIQRDWSY